MWLYPQTKSAFLSQSAFVFPFTFWMLDIFRSGFLGFLTVTLDSNQTIVVNLAQLHFPKSPSFPIKVHLPFKSLNNKNEHIYCEITNSSSHINTTEPQRWRLLTECGHFKLWSFRNKHIIWFLFTFFSPGVLLLFWGVRCCRNPRTPVTLRCLGNGAVWVSHFYRLCKFHHAWYLFYGLLTMNYNKYPLHILT